jgi:hypothetical protein
MYNNIYPSFKQMSLEFCSCINMYSLEVISSKPVEFFLEYGPQDIIYKLLLYVYVYFCGYIFS